LLLLGAAALRFHLVERVYALNKCLPFFSLVLLILPLPYTFLLLLLLLLLHLVVLSALAPE